MLEQEVVDNTQEEVPSYMVVEDNNTVNYNSPLALEEVAYSSSLVVEPYRDLAN
jgi:hypothetical protein